MDGLNENDVCIKIGKCSDNEGKHAFRVVMDAHKTKRTLVGDDECTYGPSHWCSSEEVAKKCDVNIIKPVCFFRNNFFFSVNGILC